MTDFRNFLLDIMVKYLKENYGNPSSLYDFGYSVSIYNALVCRNRQLNSVITHKSPRGFYKVDLARIGINQDFVGR